MPIKIRRMALTFSRNALPMLAQARLEHTARCEPRSFACRHGDIHRRQGMLVQAKGFSCQALDQVARDCAAAASRRDRQPQARVSFMVCEYGQNKIRVGKAPAALPYYTKFGRLMQTLARLERQFTDRWPPRNRASRAEALAALCTPPSKHLPTALGRHSRAKTVGTGTMQVTWIEGTFHKATWAKSTGQINELADLRKAARVLTGHGSVNRRTAKLELDSLPLFDCLPRCCL
jgi:hypothetical protein